MNKGKINKILTACAIGVLTVTTPFMFAGCDKDSDFDLRIEGDHVQWLAEDGEWENLISIDELKEVLGESYKGEKGETGATGPKGDKGDPGLTGPKGDQGDPGKDGQKVEFRVNGEYVQWRYYDQTQSVDDNWTNLMPITAIKGDKGDQGDPGKDMVAEECTVTYDFNLGNFTNDGGAFTGFANAVQNGLFNNEGYVISTENSYEKENFVVCYKQETTKGNYFDLYDFSDIGLSDWFDGWYYGDLKVDNARVVAQDVTLVAKWKRPVIDLINDDYFNAEEERIFNYSFEYQAKPLSVFISPVRTYIPTPTWNEKTQMVVRELVLKDNKFYKVTNINNSNDPVLYNRVFVPETMLCENIKPIYFYSENYDTEVYALNETTNDWNGTRRIGYGQDFAIESINNGSIIYQVDWNTCEATLLVTTGDVFVNNDYLKIEDFVLEKDGKKYEFKVKKLDRCFFAPKYDDANYEDVSKTYNFIVSKNTEMIETVVNYIGIENYDIRFTVNIFSESKHPQIELSEEAMDYYIDEINIYYYSQTKPIGTGNYWHYDTDGTTPVVWDLSTEG